jgi:hypothetical protein
MALGSFLGSVELPRDGRREIRAHVAIVGSNVEALTSKETFRIPLERCVLVCDGPKFVVRNEEGSLAIGSDDDAFLDALESAQRGLLRGHVRRLRSAQRRRRALVLGAKSFIAAVVLYAACVPVTRWALGGGIPTMMDQIGESALVQLGLHTELTPAAEKLLNNMAKQLQPASSLSARPIRVLLAGYTDVHTFHLPPDVVVVTSGLVCKAADANLVMAAVALELAHLEARDASPSLVSAVDWSSPMNFLSGDNTRLRERMLDYADRRRSPGYSQEQEEAAEARAVAILKQVLVPPESEKDIAALVKRVKELHDAPEGNQHSIEKTKDNVTSWSDAQTEACNLIESP